MTSLYYVIINYQLPSFSPQVIKLPVSSAMNFHAKYFFYQLGGPKGQTK